VAGGTSPPRLRAKEDRRSFDATAHIKDNPKSGGAVASVRELYSGLTRDPWRKQFSDDIENVHRVILKPGATTDVITDAINEWLKDNQPCLFGRIAAKQGLLRFCVLNEQLLTSSDAEVKKAIQNSRMFWHAEGYNGDASGFVIVAVSDRLAHAQPDATLASLAQRICELYLLHDVPLDTSCTDTMYLEKPGHARRTWKWLVGANFFGAQGDMRWWHDHRLPGGIAFSMNSVGHMAKSGAINRAMGALDSSIGEIAEDWDDSHVDSLEKALILAMRTIRVASEGRRPGTRLFSNTERQPILECPMKLPPDLRGQNHCQYFGQYHTDHSLPSDYFADAIDRPETARSFDDLDFSYLFDRSLDDFTTMGEGLPVREKGLEEEFAVQDTMKRWKAIAEEVSVDDEPLLREALLRAGRSPGS
jgi:hypothetical protein